MKVLAIIIDKVTQAVKSGMSLPWVKPWKMSRPRNAVTGHAYTGMNYFIALMFGNDSLFVTYNQARAEGGNVKTGAKGIPIVFYKQMGKGTFDAKGREETFPFLRYYTVFALKDTEGLEHLRPAQVAFVPVASAEAIAARIDAPIAHGGNVAGYYPSRHEIIMPLRESFLTPEAYYCTLFHEAVHATGKHLGHDLAKNGHGIAYSKEELVAEMGAAMLANSAGIWSEVLERNSTAYVANWLKRIAIEPNILMGAAKEAQKRVDFLLGVNQPEATE